jgi:putative endonuclease
VPATTHRRALGALGERLAIHHLEEKGYRILARNFRVGASGEIDIIADDGGTIAFVEVKCRRGSSMGRAIEAITPAKGRRLVALAQAYAAEHAPDAALRIDVVAIDFASDGRLESLEHYENAVMADY